MALSLRGFLAVYTLIVAILFVAAVLVSLSTSWPLYTVVWMVYLWVGFGYVAASILAWTGFANLYRYSPTLLLGSRTYRRQIVHGQLWKEGRDDPALLIGIAFGLALVGLGAGLANPIFAVADLAGIAAVAVLVRYRRSHARVPT